MNTNETEAQMDMKICNSVYRGKLQLLLTTATNIELDIQRELYVSMG